MSSPILKWQQTLIKWFPKTLIKWFPTGIGGTVTAFFMIQEEWERAIVLSAITAVLPLWARFSEGFMERMEEGVNERGEKLAGLLLEAIDSLPEKLKWKFSKFQGRYYKSLIYNYRYFKTQGLKIKGPIKLNLEKLFVPLRVKPEIPEQISSEIVQTREPAEGLKIWDLLAASRTKNAYRSIVIIGAPGSGKTTLLEHLTLVYAQNHQRKYDRKAPKLIPILLYLRDVAKTIDSSQPTLTLAALVEQQESIANLNPPPNWFDEKLRHKQCLVMLDGLDEVADKNQRQVIGSWLDRQIKDYPEAIFLLTSRPFGYQNASIEEIRTVLEVRPFNLKQMEQFINSWYLQNEIARSLGEDDPGVRQEAQNKANDLIGRIKNNSSLVSMALNPLLLTMIATIHAYRGALPGRRRRVELYAQICDVLLGSRQDAKGITDALTADQKKIVLQVLALKLMKRGIREFSPKQEEEQENSLIEIIQNQLAQVTSDEIKPKDFLEQVEKISGLLVEKEKGVYGFAHKSFQEYLAAVEIIKTNQENILTENISNIWWQETIRLYAAQSDASNLITAALNEDTVAALKLALDCQEEGLIIKPEVRQQLREKLDKGLESSEPEVFKLAVEVKLAKRLSQVLRIDEERAIDNSYITCAEYQLFVNELQNSESSFPGKNAKQPAIIENWSDAIDFCGWFSEKANSNLIANQLTDQKYYRLPQGTEIANHLANEHRGLECWNFEEDLAASKGIRLVQTKTRNIFGFDVITVNNQGQETQRKRRYAKYVTEKLGNGIDLDMVAIPGGTFMMGSLEGEGSSNEKPQHEVTVQPFALGKYPITQAQYQGVMGINPSYFKGNEQRPVECVSWNDAVEFCQRLSGQTGKEYRLPSEAEWEYACRAGTTTKYYFGDDITSDLANYDGNVGETTSVGQYSPNAFGLYDMHGNVWEWCQDKWHDNYQDAPNDGRAWVSGGISIFVLRGGSWDGFPRYCRSAYRGRDVPDDTVNDLGFRVACGGART